MAKSKLILILLGVLLAGLAGYYVLPLTKAPLTAQQNSKALIGGSFSLIDHHGNGVTDQDYRGKYMLIYFGYTYCPDVCPTELQIMADALDLLPKETLAQVVPLFITIDPKRDTVPIMAQYVAAFHPAMIGLTGSAEQIKAVKSAYRVYAAREKPPEGTDADAYLMSHTSYVYLMDRKGDYITHFNPASDAKDMARRLQEIIG